ncbi:MAG TPA: carboxypeptidase-like regulatory domain-containing protein [Chitinophagaceae bacterium]
MTDREVAQFFKKPSAGSVCGRFMHDQLNRDLEIPRKRIPWVKYFFQIALPAFLASAKVSAQGKVKLSISDTLTNKASMQTTQHTMPVMILGGISSRAISVERKLNSIFGEVTDENGNPIISATVQVKRTSVGAFTDTSGIFYLKLGSKEKKATIVVSSVGFESKEIEITAASYEPGFQVVLTPVNSLLMGDIVITKCFPSKKAKSIPLIPGVIKDTLTKLFKVFPNPVKAGGSMSLEWNKAEAGNYFMQLIGQGGQLVHSRQLWIDAEARILDLEVPNVTTGAYFLRMTHSSSGKSYTEKVIIQ